MRRIGWAALLAGLIGCGAGAAVIGRGKPAEKTGEVAKGPGGPIELVELPPAEARREAPGFEGASAWLNVDRALSSEALAGRVVVVDFWTSCCINCMHTLPILERLEKRFEGQPFVVVGVHSPKFEEEKEAGRLKDFLADHGVRHPVAVDGAMKIWDRWQARAWPTVAVLDARGRVIWSGSGEPDEVELTRLVASALEEGRREGRLARGPLPGLRAEEGPKTPLRYPGKVLALSDGGLAVADTGQNRVVLLGAGGELRAVFGSGEAGLVDGAREAAAFRRPEGMAEARGKIFVADTGNHAVRSIDLATGEVKTLAGTGEIGGYLSGEGRPARETALRSPWALLERGGRLYVALAGSHQIGLLDLEAGEISLFAGTGEESIEDGDRLDATFAQPSALATDGRELFVLDSETSSVRAIDFASGRVRTVVGKGLFDFGDVDGDRDRARLQHPIGMAYAAGALFVADSYNSKLKRVDPRSGSVKTLLGGPKDGALAEPAGVSARGAELFIADTNHHRVLRLPIAAPASLQPVALGGLAPPGPSPRSPRPVTVNPADPVARLGTLRVAPGKSRFRVGWSAPPGTGVNEKAPFKVTWVEASGLARLPAPRRALGKDVQEGFEVEVEPVPGAKEATLRGVMQVVLCDKVTQRVCTPLRRTVEARLLVDPSVSPSAPPAAAIVELPAAEPSH